MSIQSVFDKFANDYDASRKKLIPCFDDFYRTAIEAIPFDPHKAIDVLDLGAGTGLTAGLVAARYENAAITLVDIAGKMLDEAKTRLAFHHNTCEFITADYSEIDTFFRPRDVIISSLSIHHLTDTAKQKLFKTIFCHLRENGIFINADQVLGETEEIENVYRQKWLEQVRGNRATDTELSAALERMQEDRMSPLSQHIQWMKDAGFMQINCWYKNYSFTVVSGSRTSA